MNTQNTIYGGMLVRNMYTGEVARVHNITLDPYFVPGYHQGEAAIMAYVVGDGYADYWNVNECQPVAQFVDVLDTVEVADCFGHVGYGVVLDVIEADFVVALEDGEIYLLHTAYIVNVMQADVLEGAA